MYSYNTQELITAMAAAAAQAAGELAIAAQAAQVSDTLQDRNAPINLANDAVDGLVKALEAYAGGKDFLLQILDMVLD